MDERSHDTGKTKGKAAAASVTDFARLADDPRQPDLVSIGVHPFTSSSEVRARAREPCHVLVLCRPLPWLLRSAHHDSLSFPQLVLHIPEEAFGREVIIEVQNKLPTA